MQIWPGLLCSLTALSVACTAKVGDSSSDGALAPSGVAGSTTGPGGVGSAGSGNVVGPNLTTPDVLGTEGSGNGLDHAQLFKCDDPTATASAPRVYRLSGSEYENVVKQLVGKTPVPGFTAPFGNALTLTRFSNYASSFGMSDVDLEMLLDAAEAAAPVVLKKLEGSIGCLKTPPLSDDCAKQLINQVGSKALRRPLRDEERTRHWDLFAGWRAQLGDGAALQTVIQTFLSLPETVFRMELGDESPDASGRTKLSPYELADLVAFSVTDSPPDDQLLAAAKDASIYAPEVLKQHVVRLFGMTPSKNGTVARFFREYLRYPKLVEIFQAEFNSKGAPQALVANGDAWIANGIDKGPGLWQYLLRSQASLLGNSVKIPFGIPKEQMLESAFVATPERFGFLSQPAWLFAHSQSGETDPIRRGKFVYESLLCNDVPNIPIGVVPVLPEIEGATQRQRLADHTKDTACQACHQLMDPIGLGMEQFDHLGRYRMTEQDKPIDASGTLVGSRDRDGAFSGIDELTQKLVLSERAQQCFVRHAFRYWAGRNEQLPDSCTLATAASQFRGGENLVDLVVAIVASDSSIYRAKNSPEGKSEENP